MSTPDPRNWPLGQVGFAAIVGRPNVGKSTFLNRVLDYHLAAVSDKPQTTRRHWSGILSDETSQIVFVDTPGAHLGKTVLNHMMLDAVDRSLLDADVILCMADPSRAPGDEDVLIAERVGAAGKPAFLLLNKADVCSADEQDRMRGFYLEHLGESAAVFAVSALAGDGVDEVLAQVRQALPRGPFLYPPDQVTNSFERDIGAEMIREAALELFREEVPHCLAVEIDEWREAAERLTVRATLYVERESQKGIVVGRGGERIKQVRSQAEKTLHESFGLRVRLKLFVKVAQDWRNKPRFLADMGLDPRR